MNNKLSVMCIVYSTVYPPVLPCKSLLHLFLFYIQIHWDPRQI